MLLRVLCLPLFSFVVCLLIECEWNGVQHYQIRVLHRLFTVGHRLVLDADRPQLSAEFRASESLLRRRPVPPLQLAEDPSAVVRKIRQSSQLHVLIPHPHPCRLRRRIDRLEGNDVETYWIDFRPSTTTTNESNWHLENVLLYFHGGGYALGDIHGQCALSSSSLVATSSSSSSPSSPSGHSGLSCHLSRYFGMPVIYLEYRLIPEHPLSAAVDDAVTLYRVLLREGFQPSRLAVLGDSAGGGLALLTIQSLLGRSLPRPRAVLGLSAWTDLTLSSASFERNRAKDPLIGMEKIGALVQLIFSLTTNQLARNDSRYSPLFGSFHGFPPMYLSVGTAEVLEDDTSKVAAKARRQGVDVTFVPAEHMFHVYPIFFSYFPEAHAALTDMARWLSEQMPFPRQ